MESRPRLAQSSIACASAAAICLAASATILVGWITGAPALVRIRADWFPMQPNTAVGLVLASAGAILALRRSPRSAVFLGAAAGALAALAATQDVFHFDLGIDTAAVGSWPESAAFRAGRMPPNASAGVLLSSAAVVATAVRLWAVAAVCSVGAWALGAGALLGYALGLEAAYDWGTTTPMAPTTAAVLVLLSTALLGGGRRGARSVQGGTWYAPLIAGLGSVAIALLFYEALLLEQAARTQSAVDATARRIRTEIRTAIDAQRHVLTGLAREWQDTFFRRRGAWESDVRIAIARSGWFESIAWCEPDGELNWSYPPDGEVPCGALPRQQATPEGAHSWLDSLRLADGSRGFVLVVPLLDAGAVEGWLYGVFRSRDFFGDLAAVLPEGFAFQIDAPRAMIYDGGRSEAMPRRWVRRFALQSGSEVTVTLHPTFGWIAEQRSLLPQVILAAGIALSLLLVFAVRAAQNAAARAVALEGEVLALARAEDEVRRLNLELENRVARRTAELQQKNRDLESFAAFLSHELRQPVAAQAMWAELLEEDYASVLDDQGREYVAEIRRQIKRAGDLISAQLAIAEVGSSPLEIGNVDLTEVLAELQCDLKPELEAVNATIQRSELPTVVGDRRLLHQLFRNLVENSLKFRRQGIDPAIRVSGDSTDAGVEILYADNGRGFDAVGAQRVFGEFERLDASPASGLGLGLAVCRRIVARHGGAIEAHGEVGRGASFRIVFPAPGARLS